MHELAGEVGRKSTIGTWRVREGQGGTLPTSVSSGTVTAREQRSCAESCLPQARIRTPAEYSKYTDIFTARKKQRQKNHHVHKTKHPEYNKRSGIVARWDKKVTSQRYSTTGVYTSSCIQRLHRHSAAEDRADRVHTKTPSPSVNACLTVTSSSMYIYGCPSTH